MADRPVGITSRDTKSPICVSGAMDRRGLVEHVAERPSAAHNGRGPGSRTAPLKIKVARHGTGRAERLMLLSVL